MKYRSIYHTLLEYILPFFCRNFILCQVSRYMYVASAHAGVVGDMVLYIWYTYIPTYLPHWWSTGTGNQGRRRRGGSEDVVECFRNKPPGNTVLQWLGGGYDRCIWHMTCIGYYTYTSNTYSQSQVVRYYYYSVTAPNTQKGHWWTPLYIYTVGTLVYIAGRYR